MTGPTAPGATKPGAVDLLRLLVTHRPGGEVRPQQERMVVAVESAIATRRHALVQAGTGTGKSLGYLVPAIASGERVVVSTATKQLSEQIVNDDLPALNEILPTVGGSAFTYALLKGRSNYLCRNKVQEMVDLDGEAPEPDEAITEALFAADTAPRPDRRPSREDLDALNALLQWADRTDTGDRSHAPAASDRVWGQVSTDAAGCPGAKACPFGQSCFSERARWAASEAQVVVTNHAQVAQDLRNPAPVLGEYSVLVADEVHELESYLSSAWGVEVSPNGMRHALAQAARKITSGEGAEDAKTSATKAMDDLAALHEMLNNIDPGLLLTLPEHVADLLTTIAHRLRDIARYLDLSAGDGKAAADVAAARKGASQKVAEMAGAVIEVLTTTDAAVRWLDNNRDRKAPALKTAPLWVGPELMTLLGDRTLVATSATIVVGGSFDPMARTLALTEPVTTEDGQRPARGYDALDVGTPFNYDTQALLYVPGRDFPAPVGKERADHTQAVLSQLTSLVAAAGGRTLALFTTREAARNAAAHLRSNVTTPVLLQGEAPPAQLLREFADDEASTLCATMGFWHGVNVPGQSLSCVVMDKIPFAPMDDPLMSARRAAVDRRGGNGFADVYVATAAVMLAQGAGRLVRTATDRGVVAVLDPRLRTKPSYGPTMLRSLPPMRQFADVDVVTGALRRLTGTSAADPGVPAQRTVTSAAPGATRSLAAPAPARKAAPRRSATRALSRSTRGSGQA